MSKAAAYKTALLAAIFIMTHSVSGQTCPKRVPTIEESYVADGITLKSQQVRWVYDALKKIDEMAIRNSYFSSIPQSRLRNDMFAGVYYEKNTDPKLSATINVVAYSPKGWDNKCGIIPQADRIAAGEGFIGFALNNVSPDKLGSTMLCPYHDDQLQAFYEPVPAGTVAGYPYYDVGYFHLVLLTFNRKQPWLPVSVDEFLDLTERRLNEDFRNRKAQQQLDATRQYDEAAAMQVYYALKKSDAQKAEEYLKTIQAMKQRMSENANHARQEIEQTDQQWKTELDALQKFRRSLASSQRNAQAVTGDGPYHLCVNNNNNCRKENGLVKLNPDFYPYVKDKRIKLISIRYNISSKQEGWAALIQKTVESLDYTALQALMR